MECYKCGSEEELSKKSKSLMICRTCRRTLYERYKEANKPTIKIDPSYLELAEASVKRISARFR